MPEYIDKQAFLDYMKRTDRYFNVKFDIESFPNADVAPVVHGRWIYKGDSDMWLCSRCGRSINADPEGIDLYCYHCGAKMAESEDKNEIS